MKFAAVLALFALAACVPADASARFDGTTLNVEDSSLAKVWSNLFDVRTANPVPANQEGDKAVVLIEYAVLPPVQEKFVEIFKKLQDETEKEEGVKVFGLSRTLDTNLPFYLYSEWEDMKAYGAHFKADYVKEYLEEIAKIGVVWKLHILEQITFIKPGTQ